MAYKEDPTPVDVDPKDEREEVYQGDQDEDRNIEDRRPLVDDPLDEWEYEGGVV